MVSFDLYECRRPLVLFNHFSFQYWKSDIFHYLFNFNNPVINHRQFYIFINFERLHSCALDSDSSASVCQISLLFLCHFVVALLVERKRIFQKVYSGKRKAKKKKKKVFLSHHNKLIIFQKTNIHLHILCHFFISEFWNISSFKISLLFASILIKTFSFCKNYVVSLFSVIIFPFSLRGWFGCSGFVCFVHALWALHFAFISSFSFSFSLPLTDNIFVDIFFFCAFLAWYLGQLSFHINYNTKIKN